MRHWLLAGPGSIGRRSQCHHPAARGTRGKAGRFLMMEFGVNDLWSITTEPQYGSTKMDIPPSYLTPTQAARFLRIRHARLLYEGRHYPYFLMQGRTQWQFPRM